MLASSALDRGIPCHHQLRRLERSQLEVTRSRDPFARGVGLGDCKIAVRGRLSKGGKARGCSRDEEGYV